MSTPPSWEVFFYQSERGESPVEEFLNRLPVKARAKCLAYIEQLEKHGYALPRTISRKSGPIYGSCVLSSAARSTGSSISRLWAAAW